MTRVCFSRWDPPVETRRGCPGTRNTWRDGEMKYSRWDDGHPGRSRSASDPPSTMRAAARSRGAQKSHHLRLILKLLISHVLGSQSASVIMHVQSPSADTTVTSWMLRTDAQCTSRSTSFHLSGSASMPKP